MVGPCGAPSAEALHRDLAGASGVQASVDRLEDGVVLVRLMSGSGPAFHDARARLASASGSTNATESLNRMPSPPAL
jgi:hypothetical protein